MTEEEESELKKKQQQLENEKAIASSIPPKLTCPFIEHGIHIIKDAVLVPCCGHFICCDECIREKISHEEIVECPMKDCGHEIDSLESITSHHQMRNMVNEYLNDVKLNKFNNNNNNSNEKSSKNDDVFIDLYLNDDFQTRPIYPNNNIVQMEINEVLKKTENTQNLYCDIYNHADVKVVDKSFGQNANFQSPLQDELHDYCKNFDNSSFIPATISSHLDSVSNEKVNFSQQKITKFVPKADNAFQNIDETQATSTRYIQCYPLENHQDTSTCQRIARKGHSFTNNIPFNQSALSQDHFRGYMMNYGALQSYDMNLTNFKNYAPNYYTNQSVINYHQPLQYMNLNMHVYNENPESMYKNNDASSTYATSDVPTNHKSVNMHKFESRNDFANSNTRHVLERE